MTTLLRMIYEVLGCFETATHLSMCQHLTNQLNQGVRPENNLARYFSDALTENEDFNQFNVAFIPPERVARGGRNPVTTAMYERTRNEGSISVTSPDGNYVFTYREREVPHLRAANIQMQPAKGWIDYVALAENRPILGEIKWRTDKNPFYALIQLLTYLSEISTPNQIARANEHNLFGVQLHATSPFDLHIFLANINDGGAAGLFIGPSFELASAFKRRLINDHPEAALRLGDILCISGQIIDGGNEFAMPPSIEWRV